MHIHYYIFIFMDLYDNVAKSKLIHLRDNAFEVIRTHQWTIKYYIIRMEICNLSVSSKTIRFYHL